MVGDDINWNVGTFEIVSSDTESFKNGEKFFVVGIVVQFRVGKGTGVEGDGMHFIVIGNNGKNCTESII